jgi:hypothetical protein
MNPENYLPLELLPRGIKLNEVRHYSWLKKNSFEVVLFCKKSWVYGKGKTPNAAFLDALEKVKK